jgi:hypothetical protein
MTPATENVVASTKVLTALEHIRNNRIEYLLVLIVSHFLGLTDKLITQASGVCF